MSQSGATASQESLDAFESLRAKKVEGKRKLKWIILKLDDAGEKIVVEEVSEEKPHELSDEQDPEKRRAAFNAAEAKEWERFTEKLTGGSGAQQRPRYAVFDFAFMVPDGERNKITFIAWSPDLSPVRQRMHYATSKDAFKRAVSASIHVEIQANDPEDIQYASAVKYISKGAVTVDKK